MSGVCCLLQEEKGIEMDKRKEVGDIWYAAQGHRLRQRQRGCCLRDLVILAMVLFALRACIG